MKVKAFVGTVIISLKWFFGKAEFENQTDELFNDSFTTYFADF